ncbi:S8 family serine peptidase [Myroides fluvii]|uniref:S8 family serine peptidase n=1 Tax=Myroides fluvii TaxID=2572594 RepID=UPI00131ACB24|nr:S8 family serine peptidase [Myroides fluvii]
MKKNIVLVLSFAAFCSFSMHAQNQEQKRKIVNSYKESVVEEKRTNLLSKFRVEKQEAHELAKANNRPIEGVTEDGRAYSLQRVEEDGTYIYYITSNAGSRVTARVNDIATGGDLGLNLDGKGVTVGVWDGAPGLDLHVEFKGVEGFSRVNMKDALPDLNRISQAALNRFVKGRSHATHVIGTILNKGVNASAKGIAPEATVVSYNWEYDTEKMDLEASENGLLVSNHSYGVAAISDDGSVVYVRANDFGTYDRSAQAFDWITHTYKYYQPVVAAGNDQDYAGKLNPTKNGADLLLGHTVSKNAIVVAAVSQVANYTGPASVRIAYFSSNGPTNDFRIKPDISAKGVNVYSSNYVLPTPVIGVPRADAYATFGGTSMAAPAITGVIALWQQWAIGNKPMPFKSATIRALMAHTADEAGDAPGPDHKFGWGLINAKAGVQVMLGANAGVAIVEENELMQEGVYEKEFIVKESGGKIIATLSWTDPEGLYHRNNSNENYVLFNPSLVNDLDLRVFKDGVEYYPWRLNKDFNNLFALQDDNDVDNIEKIEIEGAEAGTYTIRVSHKGVLQDGGQEYSLIVSSADFNNLSTEEFELNDLSFSIWPNPVVDQLNVTIPEEIQVQGMSIQVFDMTGRLVKNVPTLTSNQVELDMKGLSSGTYFVKIKGNGVDKTERIVKK